ncbi:hypothetical protein AALO_G00039880 [Alosa alosa]|uniref:Uncharacterized protein n=1 Tax=Alosa alosa TaxID=278164 RepID=A0AAV6HBN6_9TELE|nr:hypothetical protein AALO_G00039880 [Alosa alosa]
MKMMESTMLQGRERYEWLVGAHCCRGREPVLVMGTWASPSGLPPRSTHAATTTTTTAASFTGTPRQHATAGLSVKHNTGSRALGRCSK